MSVLGSPAYTRGLKVTTQIVESTGNTEAFTMQMPANTYIQQIVVNNTTNNILLGGLKCGTTNGGVDVLAALAVGAAAFVADIPLKTVFSRTQPQTLYFDAVTSWNSAEIDVQIVYGSLST